MNTKEAIEFDHINFLKSFKEFVTREFYNPLGIRDVNKRIDEIIDLLKRGEKYEEMWGEFKKKYGSKYLMHYKDEGACLINSMDEYEQKYFPKEEVKSDGS